MRKFAGLLVLLALVVVPVSAQNIAGTIGFDLVPGSPYFDDPFGGNSVADEDSDIDTALTVTAGETFETLVRLNDADKLLGITFDFEFDNTILEVVDIRETLMDLDFSGSQDFAEVNAIVEFFLQAFANPPALVDTFTYEYNDGTGQIVTAPGILMDLDGDGELSFGELDAYIGQFLDNLADVGVPFWTQVVSKRPGYNESVAVFDTPAAINAAGEAKENTSVLLARPDRVDETAALPREGFGFTGNAILKQVTFKAKAAGTCDIVITEAKGIDEGFKDVTTNVYPVANKVTSTVTVQ